MAFYDKGEMGRQSAAYGFQRDIFEKVYRLKETLAFLNSEPIMKEHLLLKGRTAINLTIFNLPRLSVDIDLDYIPNDSREEMLKVREQLSLQLKEHMEDEGYLLNSGSRKSHSLDAFYFQYTNCAGNRDMIKIEINYSLRSHVLDSDERNISTDAFGNQMTIRTVAPMEIFAAKVNALMSRAAARDLYDFNNFINAGLFENDKDLFRKIIIFYATISADRINKAFDTSAIDEITFRKIKRDLLPMLSGEEVRGHFDTEEHKEKAKTYIKNLMHAATDAEREYMICFENGKYQPELLFDDKKILKRIEKHPMALWKISKVKV